jgi:cell division septum initiation protein DivIVA
MAKNNEDLVYGFSADEDMAYGEETYLDDGIVSEANVEPEQEIVQPYALVSEAATHVANGSQSVIELLDQLSELVNEAVTTMFSQDTVKLNRDEVLNLLDGIKSELPAQLANADQILKVSHDTLDEAKVEAGKIIEKGRKRAKEAAEKENVVKEAKKRANQLTVDAENNADSLLKDAKIKTDKLVHGAEVYANRVLKSLLEDIGIIQNNIDHSVKVAHEGRLELKNRAQERAEKEEATEE